jgi:hypothetical protein
MRPGQLNHSSAPFHYCPQRPRPEIPLFAGLPAITRSAVYGPSRQKRRHLSGAALDVVAEEPLRAASRLWDTENVLITAHSMSAADEENEAITELFCENPS